MADSTLPGYLKSASPNPMEKRVPWYKNTAPSYAGIFLSVPFMGGMAGALIYGSLWAAFVGLVVGALFCLLLFYVPGMLGMRTGMPLYVVGASTFGTKGGILMPGLVMGVLQIGWHSVMTYAGAGFVMALLGYTSPSDAPGVFWVVCLVWGLALALVGAIGIGLLGKLSTVLPILPLIMVIVAGFANMGGLGNFKATSAVGVAAGIPILGLAMFAALQAVAGFFATAGAAGADFCMNNRNEKDVVLGGFFGITLIAIVTGFFAMLAMAGAMGADPQIAAMAGTTDCFIKSIMRVGGGLAWVMYIVFILASICPTGFCAFLFANAFSTMFPKLPRVPMALAAGLIGAIGAATGAANELVIFFVIIGASFGPVIGAMAAEYLRHGKWMGPRKGINWAGYIAWAVGLAVGVLGMLPKIGVPKSVGFSYGLETLMSFVAGFAVYLILANFGLEPEPVARSGAALAGEGDAQKAGNA